MSRRLESSNISVPKMREKMENSEVDVGKKYLNSLKRNIIKDYAIKASSHIERDLTNPRFKEILGKLATKYGLTQGKDSDLVFAKKVLQTGLVPYGYDKSKIDGVIGRGVMKALLAFQKEESCKNVYRQLEGDTEFPHFSLDKNKGRADLIPNGRTFLALAILAGIEQPKTKVILAENCKPEPAQIPNQTQTPTPNQTPAEGEDLSTELSLLEREEARLLNSFINKLNDGKFSKEEAENLIGKDNGESLKKVLEKVKNHPDKYPNLDGEIKSLLKNLKKDEKNINVIKTLTTILERVFNIVIPSANADENATAPTTEPVPANTPDTAPANTPDTAPANTPDTAPANTPDTAPEPTTEDPEKNPQEKSVKEMTDMLNSLKGLLGFTEYVNFEKESSSDRYFLGSFLTIKGHQISIGINSSGNYLLFKDGKGLKIDGGYETIEQNRADYINEIDKIKKALENLKTPEEEKIKELLLSGNIDKKAASDTLNNTNLTVFLNSMDYDSDLKEIADKIGVNSLLYWSKEGCINKIIEKLREIAYSEKEETIEAGKSDLEKIKKDLVDMIIGFDDTKKESDLNFTEGGTPSLENINIKGYNITFIIGSDSGEEYRIYANLNGNEKGLNGDGTWGTPMLTFFESVGDLKKALDKLETKEETTEVSPSIGSVTSKPAGIGEINVEKVNGIIRIKVGDIKVGKITQNIWDSQRSNTYKDIELNDKRYDITVTWAKNTGKINLNFNEVTVEDVKDPNLIKVKDALKLSGIRQIKEKLNEIDSAILESLLNDTALRKEVALKIGITVKDPSIEDIINVITPDL